MQKQTTDVPPVRVMVDRAIALGASTCTDVAAAMAEGYGFPWLTPEGVCRRPDSTSNLGCDHDRRDWVNGLGFHETIK